MRRIRAVMVKEFHHILRDPASLTIILLMPMIMILIYGYSISYDLDHIRAGIINRSSGELSDRLIQAFARNRTFEIVSLTHHRQHAIERGEGMLRSGELKEIIIIPADFDRLLRTGRQAEVGIIIAGSDANVANLTYQYNELILNEFMNHMLDYPTPMDVDIKIHFNPEVRSSFFFVPGIIAVILVMVSALLTSLSITREKESGSIDLIFISPLRSSHIIIGKTVPYILVALLDGIVILLFARFWFGIPFRGDLLVLLLFSLLYILSGLALGIVISTIAPNQKTAMFAALLITLLPSIMLSGFIFPLDSLAAPLQWLSRIIPATYFLRIIRGVALKGAELRHYLLDGVMLLLFSVLFMTLAGLRFTRLRRKKK